MSCRVCLPLFIVSLSLASAPQAAADRSVLITEDFERDLGRWFTTDPDPSQGAWQLASDGEGSKANRYLRVLKASDYQPPFRSPHSIALLNDVVVTDFELTARVQNTNPRAGAHRDLCLFWGYQDPAHFYYAHLGASPDAHSCQVFVVDGAPRTKITIQESPGTPWTDGWHNVKIVRKADDGLMEVYFDDLTKPCMTAKDARFAWGQVGIGTFDDSGNFDDIRLVGTAIDRPKPAPIAVTIRNSDHGAVIEADGKPFAEYRKKSGRQPAIWPLFTLGGKPLTRSWPIGPREAHEQVDHPHHHSLWFTHGDVNGYDFWEEPDAGGPNTQIEHREFLRIEGGSGAGTLIARNDWTADGKRILEDLRTWTFGADRNLRWVDLTIDLKATEGPVVFGDTKEGTFAVRVAGTMTVDEKLGGRIFNSRQQVDADAWGQSAQWVDYSGPVQDGVAGIAMLSHPGNFRPECRWHVRTYGLFAANPFGASDFPPGEPQQGAYTLPAGQTLTLRYRLLLHDGTLPADVLADAFAEYTQLPTSLR